jgi:hypothetical protein
MGRTKKERQMRKDKRRKGIHRKGWRAAGLERRGGRNRTRVEGEKGRQ